MSSSFGKYMIISAGDLPTKDSQHLAPAGMSNKITSTMESDCACPTDDLVLVSDLQITQKPLLLEDDCACPTDGFVIEHPASLPSESTLFVMPKLHIAEITDDFNLVFNPLGNAGVVALNQQATSLLHVFQQPKTLVEGTLTLDDARDSLSAAHRLAELNLLQPVGAQLHIKRSPPNTLTAWLHVTNECNLRCPYCYVSKSADDMEIGRGKQAVEAVFRSAIANGFRKIKFKYAGGEATLNFHTVLILHDHARLLADQHSLELDGVVLSNGVALSDPMIIEMKARGIRLMISLDGVGEYQDQHRPFANGKGSFQY